MVTTLATAPEAAQWLAARVRGHLRTDSRAVQPGDGFIAWPGHATDGRRFVPAALAAGAVACLVEAEDVERFGTLGPNVATLPGLKAATGAVADTYYAQPSAVLDVVATTGTNGKTSTVWWTRRR
jgi:UDP-N-acetylmuramoyl-L-alanyl-D-glutamate--2,6-diaminopimelate ligase